MKKKIIFGLAIFALMFFFGGIYIVTTTETTIYELHRLSELHQTVALRKDLLLAVKKSQDNIILRGKQHFAVEESPGDSGLMGIMNGCFRCHHTAAASETLNQLKHQMETYHGLTRATFAARPGSFASERMAESALRIGDTMVRQIERIIYVTGTNLDRREKEILRGINRKKNILFMFVTVGPFFAVGLAFILIRGFTRPVNSLIEATRILKAGDLDHRIGGLTGEFGEVANSFNEMAASLKKQMQEMQRTEQLRVSGEMAAGLAHEIRNPLAGMKLSLEVLLAELTLAERDRDVLLKNVEQIRHIELLMKNLLNYARPVAAQPVRLDINKIVDKTLYFIERHPSFLSGLSGNPQKKIVKTLDDALPEIIGDPQQLQQVFLNILLNAVDAIAEGGEISVHTCYDEKKNAVFIELHDTGQGIPPELMGKIFQPFFTTKGKGTGLGLAVSKRIIEEHGGSVEVANDASRGVTFTIILPAGEESCGVMT